MMITESDDEVHCWEETEPDILNWKQNGRDS
jgi:hypothetical protein